MLFIPMQTMLVLCPSQMLFYLSWKSCIVYKVFPHLNLSLECLCYFYRMVSFLVAVLFSFTSLFWF